MKSKILGIIFLWVVYFYAYVFAMYLIPSNDKWVNYKEDKNFFYYNSLDKKRQLEETTQLEKIKAMHEKLTIELESKKLKAEPVEDLEKKVNECIIVQGLFFRMYHPAVAYKIHLQLKQQYLIEFVEKLMVELEKPDLFNIHSFKYAKFPDGIKHKDRASGGIALPIIVLYVTEKVDFLDNEKRNEIIDPMLAELVKFVDNFCKRHKPEITIQQLAWPVVPRFNKKINDVVYIAGGNGDYKPTPSAEDEEVYRKTGKYKNTEDLTPHIGMVQYSDDLCFVKGHEYLTPMERLSSKFATLKESLSALRAKLQTLNEKLGSLKKVLKTR